VACLDSLNDLDSAGGPTGPDKLVGRGRTREELFGRHLGKLGKRGQGASPTRISAEGKFAVWAGGGRRRPAEVAGRALSRAGEGPLEEKAGVTSDELMGAQAASLGGAGPLPGGGRRRADWPTPAHEERTLRGY